MHKNINTRQHIDKKYVLALVDTKMSWIAKINIEAFPFCTGTGGHAETFYFPKSVCRASPAFGVSCPGRLYAKYRDRAYNIRCRILEARAKEQQEQALGLKTEGEAKNGND